MVKRRDEITENEKFALILSLVLVIFSVALMFMLRPGKLESYRDLDLSIQRRETVEEFNFEEFSNKLETQAVVTTTKDKVKPIVVLTKETLVDGIKVKVEVPIKIDYKVKDLENGEKEVTSFVPKMFLDSFVEDSKSENVKYDWTLRVNGL